MNFGDFTGNDGENSSATNSADSNTSNGISIESASSVETSPSTRQYTTVTQSTIIKRKGVLKPESADVEVSLFDFCNMPKIMVISICQHFSINNSSSLKRSIKF